MSSSLGPDAMRWEDNVSQELGITFVKDQIVEYVTDTSGIAKEQVWCRLPSIYTNWIHLFKKVWGLDIICIVFSIADYF